MSLAIHLDNSTSGKILKLLQQQGACGIKELEVALGVTRTAVRQPLTMLVAADMVTTTEARQKRGRPRLLYRLSEKGHSLFPQLSVALAGILLDEMLAQPEPISMRRLLPRLSARLGAQYAEPMCGITLATRLQEFITWLQAHGLISRLDEQDEAFVLTAYSCPYYDIARTHREVCVVETAALALALGAPVQLTRSRFDGSPCCQFQVQKFSRSVASPCCKTDQETPPHRCLCHTQD